jgi:hypothetical protein
LVHHFRQFKRKEEELDITKGNREQVELQPSAKEG